MVRVQLSIHGYDGCIYRELAVYLHQFLNLTCYSYLCDSSENGIMVLRNGIFHISCLFCSVLISVYILNEVGSDSFPFVTSLPVYQITKTLVLNKMTIGKI